MNANHRKQIVQETVIASCLCGILPSLAIYFSYQPLPMPVWGGSGLIDFTAKSTGIAGFLMTSLMTLGVRSKVAKGGIEPMARAKSGALEFLQRYVPRRVILRAVLFALFMVVVLCAGTAGLAYLTQLQPLDRITLVAFSLVQGALVGLVLAPLIQCAALSDDISPNALIKSKVGS